MELLLVIFWGKCAKNESLTSLSSHRLGRASWACSAPFCDVQWPIFEPWKLGFPDPLQGRFLCGTTTTCLFHTETGGVGGASQSSFLTVLPGGLWNV